MQQIKVNQSATKFRKKRSNFNNVKAPLRSKLFTLERTQHTGLFRLNRRNEFIVTRSLVKEESTIEEKVFGNSCLPSQNTQMTKSSQFESSEYRVWNTAFSPVAAGLLRMERLSAMQPGCVILCLYPGKDTAPIHFSDVVSESGHVYVVERSHKFAQIQYRYSQRRHNLSVIYSVDPIANIQFLLPMVDMIYCSNVHQHNDSSDLAKCVNDEPDYITKQNFEQVALLCLKQNGQCLLVFGCNQTAGLSSNFDISQRITLPDGRLICTAAYGISSLSKSNNVDQLTYSDESVKTENIPLPAPEQNRESISLSTSDDLEEGEIVD
ncbi:hypothetical protein GJ496_007173 [Pomphorhynchus laevis]|nr:hypothetical protein GJ496_007173 [Pomphorhynchus laevis]